MKLYVIVRRNLSSGAQAAQAIHAVNLYSMEFPERYADWYEQSNNIVVLSVPSEAELEALAQDCELDGTAVSRFREPDLDNSLTAIAVGHEGYRRLSSLPLALREPKAA